VLLGRQRPVHPRRADLEDIGGHSGGRAGVGLLESVELFGGRAGQARDGVQVERAVAVDDHGDARWARPAVDDDVFDLVAGARELAVE
jgi:hypothetical protein